MAGTPLSHVDTAWYRAHRLTNQMVIRGLFWLEGGIDEPLLAKTIDERLQPFKRFHRRIDETGTGRPTWVDVADFSIDDHLTRLKADRDEIERVLGELSVLPLDMSKPPWHAHIITLDDGSTILFFRIHHAIGDGQALVHVLLSLCDPAEPVAAVESERRRDPKWIGTTPSEPMVKPLWKSALAVVAKPAQWIGQAFLGLAKFLVLVRIVLIPPDTPTVLRGRLGTAKTVAWTDPLTVERVRRVAGAVGGTINDVLLATLTGALGRYVEERGTPVGGAELRAMVPVDVRPKDVVPDMGNRFGLVVLSLPAGERDPVERVHETMRRMDKIKRRPEAGVGFGLVRLLGYFPGAIEKLLIRFFAAKASMVVTNVIGPRYKLMIAGSPIEDVLVFVPQSGNIGLGVAFFSYDGAVRVSLMADSLRVPDSTVLARLFVEEFEALESRV